MLVSGIRAAALRRSRGHHRAAGRCAGRRELCRVDGPRRSGDRDQPDAQSRRLHRRARHRARSRRRRHGQVQGRRHQADQGRVPLPGEGDARFRRDAIAVPALRAAAGARRQERAVAGVAAAPAHRDRAAADQCAGRHHQLHHLRPRPAAARVRRRQGARQSRRAPRPRRRDACWRSTARPTRSTTAMCVIADDDGVEVARRHHGRRDDRLLGDHHRRADRIRAVGRAQHRADRPQARHQFGCALSLRARRRSGFHAAGPRAGDARWCSSCAAARRRRSSSPARPKRRRTHHRFPAVSEVKRLAGLEAVARSKCGACSSISASSSRARASK